jgi:hypothetical protein
VPSTLILSLPASAEPNPDETPEAMNFNPTLVGFSILVLCAAACSSSSGGSDDDEDAPGISDGVSVFTPGTVIRAVSGADDVTLGSFTPTSDGRFLMVNASSESVLLFDPTGAVAVLTTQQQLATLVGAAVSLGPLDQILFGAQVDELIGADANSGLLIRIDTDGTPRIHATEEQITQVTGASSAKMSLPRFLLTNQLVAQDLVTREILLFGTSGTVVTRFVGTLALAAAAGVIPDRAIIAGWARGATTGTLFGWLDTTNNIVSVSINGVAMRHLSGDRLRELFPEITNLQVHKVVTDTLSDAMIILVGEGTRGVAIAFMNNENPAGEVFTSQEQFVEVAGATYDISDIGVLSDGTPFAVDGVGVQVLTFASGGQPLLVARRESFQRETGVSAPVIGVGVRLGSTAVIVPEATSDDFLRVE